MSERPDIIERAKPFMEQCGPCDYGLPYACTHPDGDYRPIVADLVCEVERLRADLPAGADEDALNSVESLRSKLMSVDVDGIRGTWVLHHLALIERALRARFDA